MTAPATRIFLKDWSSIGLPAFAGLFLPWQNKLTSMSLMSDWFQPTLNVGASVIGPLACLAGFPFLARRTTSKKTTAMISASLLFAACVVGCIFLRMALGTILFPTPLYQVAIWTLESMLHLLGFAAPGIAMISGGLLAKAG
jgi:hypothetical protein